MTYSNLLYSQGNWDLDRSSGKSGIWKPVPLCGQLVVLMLPSSRYQTFLAVVMLVPSPGGYSGALSRYLSSQLLCLLLQLTALSSQLSLSPSFVSGLRERPLSRWGSLPVGSLHPESDWSLGVQCIKRWLFLLWQEVWFSFLVPCSSRAGERGKGGSRC